MSAVQRARARAPEAARRLVQVIADNPGQCAVLGAGGYVAAGLAVRAFRPRGLLDLIALAIVLDAAAGWAAGRLIESGFIQLRIRDAGDNADPAA